MTTQKSQGIIIELQYLPCIEYFVCFCVFEDICLDMYEYFEKQTYRNRCKIHNAHTIQELSIPVQKAGSKQIYKEVKIDHQQKWLMNHWRSITSAYGKSPFFEFYKDPFESLFQKKYDYLVDFNWDILTICLKILKLRTKLTLSEFYIEPEGQNQNLENWRSKIHPKKEAVWYSHFDLPAYTQVFGNAFVKNLSILDLIFCEGPNALNYLKSIAEKIETSLSNNLL
jgi:hypothetical protein